MTKMMNINNTLSRCLKLLLSSVAIGFALGFTPAHAADVWVRNSFPSEKHKQDGYLPFAGEMRGQRVNFFGVSPANPDFMIMAGNMAGQGFVTDNGKDFKAFGTEAGWCGNTFGFSPHDGALAFALMGTKVYRGTDEATWGTEHPYGIYRTEDTGETWIQVLRLPENIFEDSTSIDTTPGQEPIGKRVLLVDPSPTRSTHVYYASSEKGLVRSISNGDDGTWEVVAFENQFVKTMSAGVTAGDVTRLYLVVANGYSQAQVKDGQVYHDSGRLYRINIENDGEMTGPTLCLNGLYNITDVETNKVGDTGFVIVDGSAAGNESTGGRALYPFGQKGTVIPGLGREELGYDEDGATLNESDDGVVLDANDYPKLRSLGAVYMNPYNTDHWVIQVGGDLEHSFTWSNDGGSRWNDMVRDVVIDPVSGQESVPDFISGAAEQHHMKDYDWAMDQESGRSDQGSAVGFMNSTTVVWMSTSKDRPILKSTDYGATASTFTTGAETKWLNQINTAANGALVGCSFGEYGFVLSADGGETWEGFTEFSDDILNEIEGIAKKDFRKGGASNRAGFAVVFEDGIPLDQPQHAILLASRSGIVVDARQTADLLAVSSSNGKVAIATPNRVGVSSDDWALYLTADAGDTWTQLENPKKEIALSLDGAATELYPISLNMYGNNRHSIAIDPRALKDPSIPGGNLRILLAGRKGIYEYEEERAAGAKWKVMDAGLDGSLHFNDTESVPWMGSVQFDPAMSGKVYALQTSDRISMSDWKNPDINGNCIYEGEGTKKPVYMSTDWGKTWTNLDNDDLPDMLTVSTLHVSDGGDLYVGSVNSGFYQYIPNFSE